MLKKEDLYNTKIWFGNNAELRDKVFNHLKSIGLMEGWDDCNTNAYCYFIYPERVSWLNARDLYICSTFKEIMPQELLSGITLTEGSCYYLKAEAREYIFKYKKVDHQHSAGAFIRIDIYKVFPEVDRLHHTLFDTSRYDVLRLATSHEHAWLDECIQLSQFIPLDQVAISPTFKEGDWIYTLLGSSGYGMHKDDEQKYFKVISSNTDKLELSIYSNDTCKKDMPIFVRKQDVRIATVHEMFITNYVVCIKSHEKFAQGKIYPVKNGYILDDKDCLSTHITSPNGSYYFKSIGGLKQHGITPIKGQWYRIKQVASLGIEWYIEYDRTNLSDIIATRWIPIDSNNNKSIRNGGGFGNVEIIEHLTDEKVSEILFNSQVSGSPITITKDRSGTGKTETPDFSKYFTPNESVPLLDVTFNQEKIITFKLNNYNHEKNTNTIVLRKNLNFTRGEEPKTAPFPSKKYHFPC